MRQMKTVTLGAMVAAMLLHVGCQRLRDGHRFALGQHGPLIRRAGPGAG